MKMPMADNDSNSVSKRCSALIMICLSLSIALTLCLMLFAADDMDYACKTTFLIPNFALLIVCFLLAVIFFLFFSSSTGRRFRAYVNSRASFFCKVIIIATAVLFVMQVFLCKSYCFVAGWDSGVITGLAYSYATSGTLDPSYLSSCPNNLLLVWIAKQSMEIAAAFGNSTQEGGVFVFSILNCLSYAVASIAVYCICDKLFSTMTGIVAWILLALLVWTSPWTGILYSDSIVMAVPATIVWFYLMSRERRPKEKTVALLLIGLIGSISYSIKPQVIFPLFAVALFELEHCLRGIGLRFRQFPKHKSIPRIMACCVPICVLGLGAILGSLTCHEITQRIPVEINEDRQYGMTHYLMMGLNSETRGIFYQEDADYSASFPDQDTRRQANIEVTIRRIQNYGPWGLVHLFIDKQMTNFNDGTFAWGWEGHHFDSVPQQSDGWLASITHALYYPDGSMFARWQTYAQGVWIGVLFFMRLR